MKRMKEGREKEEGWSALEVGVGLGRRARGNGRRVVRR